MVKMENLLIWVNVLQLNAPISFVKKLYCRQ